jgi:hypothetical protein
MPAKLRILCLHGYQQNAAIFYNKTGSWRKSLKSQADFFFLDAPHLAKAEYVEQEAEGRSWYALSKQGS